MARTPGIQERRNRDGTVSFRAQIRVRGHEHLSKTFDRKTDAKSWLEATRSAIRNGATLSTEADRTTLADALDRYGREVSAKKKSKDREGGRIKAWKREPLASRYLSRLGGADFAKYRDRRREEGAAEQTIRLELAMISHLYTVAAKDWGMHGLRNPIKAMTLPGGANERDRRLESGEEEKLLTALKAEGPYMASLASFAIETAMRQGEILSLAWRDVDQERRVAKLADTKTGDPRDVPLSPKAVEILKALPRAVNDDTKVFPVRQDVLIRAFRAACVAAKIDDLKFHDLRHEATSRLFERGLNVAEVAAITGHKTWGMLRRYTQLRAEDLARKLA